MRYADSSVEQTLRRRFEVHDINVPHIIFCAETVASFVGALSDRSLSTVA